MDKLPVTEAEWEATPRPVPLEPDARDLQLCSTCELKPCPFCGSQSVCAHGQINKQRGIYGYNVGCANCLASVIYNANDRDVARNGAIERWQARSQKARA
jgi:hypothetical protein